MDPWKTREAAGKTVDPWKTEAATKTADGLDFDKFTPYTKAIEKIQYAFTWMAGETLYRYIETLHNRLSRREDFEKIYNFQNWDFGSAKKQGSAWSFRVWAKDGGGSAWDALGLDPNLLISLEFSDNSVSLTLNMGNSKDILKRTWSASQAEASSVGMACGEAWEKLLTGSVDYGD